MTWRPVLIAILAVLGVIALIAYAGGSAHHRGDQIGSHGTKVILVRPAS